VALLLPTFHLGEQNYMDKTSTNTFLIFVSIPRKINLLFLILFFGGGVLGMLLQIKWLSFIGPVLICISGLVPIVLVVLRLPNLAQAWFRGINPYWFPAIPWEQLSNGQKFSVYFYSVISYITTVLLAIGIALVSVHK